MPYITSQIVFQILTHRLSILQGIAAGKANTVGAKMAQWTRWSAIGLTLLQSIVATKAFQSFGIIPSDVASFVVTVVSMTAGTMFLIWLGEQITERSVSSEAVSFIIFAGIVARMPQQFAVTYAEYAGAKASRATSRSVALIALFVATVIAVIFVTQGERRIPVRYAPRQAGSRMVQAQRSHLPLKMAAAGVIPIIFAVSIVLFPGQIAQWYLTNARPARAF